jgi:hypothetical protein
MSIFCKFIVKFVKFTCGPTYSIVNLHISYSNPTNSIINLHISYSKMDKNIKLNISRLTSSMINLTIHW